MKNQGEHPELRKYMDAVDGIETLLEIMTFSARTKQTFLFQYIDPDIRYMVYDISD